jgi:hypothetical protein
MMEINIVKLLGFYNSDAVKVLHFLLSVSSCVFGTENDWAI